MPTDTVLKPPTYDDVVAARRVIARHLRKTPLIFSPSLSEELGCDYYIKAEIFQPTGAFKVRGGINFMGTLDKSEKRNQFISASAGNHGQSLAYAGRIFGTRVVVYMSAENPNLFKVNAIRRFGAEVRLHGHNTDEAVAEAQRVAREQGLRYVHHANEPKLIAGVGTMALEIFEELPDVDVIFTPVGAGSAASGNSIVARHQNPNVRVVGVQSDQSPAVWHAWSEGHLRKHPLQKTEHEGIGTSVPAELTTPILRDLLADFLLVSDDEINDAIRILAEQTKLLAEGAGAASLAGAFKIKNQLRGKKVVGILSGGNLPLDRLARVLARASAAS
ncbi:MAG: threonine/serine dehydratase [Candidatus Acidiferrales bacterium]